MLEGIYTQKLLHVGGKACREKSWQRLYLRLPSEWARRMELNKGDEVEVTILTDHLIVRKKLS